MQNPEVEVVVDLIPPPAAATTAAQNDVTTDNSQAPIIGKQAEQVDITVIEVVAPSTVPAVSTAAAIAVAPPATVTGAVSAAAPVPAPPPTTTTNLSSKQRRLIRMVKGVAGIRSKPNPFLPENSLSAVERYFHHMPDESAQVVLVYGGRIGLPKGSKHLSVSRIVDVMKLTSAEIYRTATVLDYETHTFAPMGKNASEIRITHNFTPLKDLETFAEVAKREVNRKYDVKDPNIALWNFHIVGPPEMEKGIDAPENSENFEFPKFYIFWTFHHCISDGLSGWCYIRLFMTKMGKDCFQREPPRLDNVLVTTTPPPLIDNLISTNFIELIPAYVDAIVQLIAMSRFKKYRLKNLALEKLPVTIPYLPKVVPPTACNVKFFAFDPVFSEELRLNCRKNGTTIAAAVIVAALAAVRRVFGPRAVAQGKKLPKYQAWVVTSSTRMLIPNSKLLEGADKEFDPALMEFGGYGGSIANECFKFGEKNNLWERCRTVKRHLSSSFLKSMRRLKLMNYLFRKPKLWKKLYEKLDVDNITRSYSVEVANLGAWTNVYAPLKEGVRGGDLATADWFAGTLNNSFHGARAMFTVALISINNVMSFTVSYDMSTISNEEGEIFIAGVTEALFAMKTSASGTILVDSLKI